MGLPVVQCHSVEIDITEKKTWLVKLRQIILASFPYCPTNVSVAVIALQNRGLSLESLVNIMTINEINATATREYGRLSELRLQEVYKTQQELELQAR